MHGNDKGKIVILLAALIFFACAAVQAVCMPLHQRIQATVIEKREAEALKSDISPVLAQKQKLKKEEKQLSDRIVDIIETSGGKTATKEEFLLFLGETAKKNNVGVTGFKDYGIASTGGIYTQTFDFELRGNSNNINNILAEINDMGIKTSYVSVSFRQNLEYDYLKRYFDGISAFPWFKEQDEDEEEDEETETAEDIAPSGIIELPEQRIVPQIQEQTVPYQNETELPNTKNDAEEINEDFESILEPTVHSGYANTRGNQTGIVYLSKKNEKIEPDSRMRLAVTLKLIMFNKPQDSTSFLRKEEKSDAVL